MPWPRNKSSSPDIGTDKSVSRQQEAQILRHYGHPNYWGGAGFHIQASDGKIGPGTGDLIDDETWAVRYLIVDTNNWRIAPPT